MQFIKEDINSVDFQGTFCPLHLLEEFYDKVHIERDFKGNEISRKTYIAGGPLKRISLLDEKNKRRVVIAGPENELYSELQPIQDNFEKIFRQSGKSIDEIYEDYTIHKTDMDNAINSMTEVK